MTALFTEEMEVRAWLQAIILLFPILLMVYKQWAPTLHSNASDFDSVSAM